MTERKEFTMTKEQLKKLLIACQPVPLIMLQCGMPESPQKKANRAWKKLDKEMGFEHMSVRPVIDDPHKFTAISTNKTD
ncbi:MAG: hypothetical protein ISR65_18535 [Bacteriovoracaceae bacterium]|nr:hypothetical protein [candidate division KSB1 bacterium]MBL6991786.1 hypothetical protein [Bacteriovoracaceae bacterium]